MNLRELIELQNNIDCHASNLQNTVDKSKDVMRTIKRAKILISLIKSRLDSSESTITSILKTTQSEINECEEMNAKVDAEKILFKCR